jgi:hypothetical protein
VLRNMETGDEIVNPEAVIGRIRREDTL